MSANRWSVCPRCLKASKDEAAIKANLAGRAYGQVTPEKYQEMVRAAQWVEPEPSMREDWECGIDKKAGEVYLSYFASCEKCGFEVKVEHREKVTI